MEHLTKKDLLSTGKFCSLLVFIVDIPGEQERRFFHGISL